VIAESGEPYARPRVETVLPTGGSATLPRIRALIFLAGQSAGVEALAKYDPTVTAFLVSHWSVAVRRCIGQQLRQLSTYAHCCGGLSPAAFFCSLVACFFLSFSFSQMLHGDADDCLPARCAEAISARIPRGATKQVVILPDNHHGVQDALPLLTNYVPKLVA